MMTKLNFNNLHTGMLCYSTIPSQFNTSPKHFNGFVVVTCIELGEMRWSSFWSQNRYAYKITGLCNQGSYFQSGSINNEDDTVDFWELNCINDIPI